MDEKADELRYHLDRVVARQIIADVPVGTFLSGGVDSSIVTSVVHEHMEDVTAYTIGTQEEYNPGGQLKGLLKYAYRKEFGKL